LVLFTSICILCLFLSCTRTRIPLTKIEVPMVAVPLPELPLPLPKIPLLMSGEGDYRLLPWKKAFNRLCDQIEREYPYTEWKNINWNDLRIKYTEKVKQAKDKKDRNAYYLALREFMYSIPDGNIRVEMDEEIRASAIGGGYGFAMTRTDDGQYIVFYIHQGSSAEKAGMKIGTKLLKWNNVAIETAVQETSVLWTDTPPATREGKVFEQCKLLGRAPVGTEVEVSFMNPSETEPVIAKLKAEKDDYSTLITPVWDKVRVGPTDNPLQKKKLEEKYGYVRIFFFSPSINTPFPAQAFQKVISDFIREDTPGLILDLRGNTGGDPELIPRFAGYFVEEESFFQDLAFYSKKEKGFKVSPGDRIVIKPFPLRYRGNVVVLVDYGTAGSAEGLASVLSKQKNVQVIGISDTRGAMGVPGGDVRMPNGLTVSYPVARSLDKEGIVQIEANAQGEGGIKPAVKVPLNLENLQKIYIGEEDVVLQQALDVLKNRDK